jgi:hypothetical protein
VSAPKKPTAREVWEAIDETSFRAEVDRVNAMSDAEVEAELLKDGFDPADLSLNANANAKPAPQATTGGGNGKDENAADANKTAPAKLAPVRRLPVVRIASWAVAASFVLLVGGVVVRNALPPDDVTRTPAEHAAKLREDARKACAKAQWRTCLDRLDEADKIDPDRAQDPEVRKLRLQAEHERGGL